MVSIGQTDICRLSSLWGRTHLTNSLRNIGVVVMDAHLGPVHRRDHWHHYLDHQHIERKGVFSLSSSGEPSRMKLSTKPSPSLSIVSAHSFLFRWCHGHHDSPDHPVDQAIIVIIDAINTRCPTVNFFSNPVIRLGMSARPRRPCRRR